ncbi:MAG: hypothetical protein ACYDC6_01715 [Acidobacteriaceae bacterium]
MLQIDIDESGVRSRKIMNKSTYGETLFERYLTSEQISFEREPNLPGISQLIDFVVDNPTYGKILLEVKDIENLSPSGGFSQFNPNTPIREHIEEGTRKFKSTSDYVCALVLAAPLGSFVQLNKPHVVLGAMYGDFGFKIHFDPERGQADSDNFTSEFLVDKGKMIRKSRVQNTRIAALITVQEFRIWHYAMRKYLNADDGRSCRERADDIHSGQVQLPDYDATAIGVTIWENAVALRKLPTDLFRGEMDAWWEFVDGGQVQTYVGGRRRSLGIDNSA